MASAARHRLGWPLLRACLGIRFWVAQATGLCRPATRRTEREGHRRPTRSARCSAQPGSFRSAGRRPGRAGRPCHPFFRHALNSAHCNPSESSPAAKNSERGSVSRSIAPSQGTVEVYQRRAACGRAAAHRAALRTGCGSAALCVLPARRPAQAPSSLRSAGALRSARACPANIRLLGTLVYILDSFSCSSDASNFQVRTRQNI